ncbi:MAG: hypothetical protein JW940_35410 [Polyangiaceae bacterium]|nr:hypothetical protein [Polyangiaceae bacterium]
MSGSPKGRVAGWAAVAVLAVSSAARAQSATQLLIDCPELRTTQADEFRARARLLINSSRTEHRPQRVQLHCTVEGIRLLLDQTDAAPVDRRLGIVEGALDALQAALDRRSVAAEAGRNPSPVEARHTRHTAPPARTVLRRDVSSEPHDPRVQRLRERSAERVRPWAIGGLGLGLTLEPLSTPLDFGIGPRLDVALGAGRVALVASEALRLTVGPEPDAKLLDAQAGVGYGAPFAYGEHWGAMIVVGLQWLVLPTRDQTLQTHVVGLALRSATELGPTNLWLGLDGLLRTSPPRSDDGTPVVLPPASLLLCIGGFFVAQ